MATRRWLVVPRGTVKRYLTQAAVQGIGEIEERDDVLGPEVRTETNPDPVKARDWPAELDAADTVAKKLGIVRQFMATNAREL